MRCPRCNTLLPDDAQVCGHCGEDLEIPYNPDLDALWEDSYTGPRPEEIRPGGHQQSEVVYTSARQTSEQPAGRPLPPMHLDEPPPGPPPVPRSAAPGSEPEPRPARPVFGDGADIATNVVQTTPRPELRPARQPFGAQAEIATNILDTAQEAELETEPEPQPERPPFGAQAEIATNILDTAQEATPAPEAEPEPELEPEPEPARPAFGVQAAIATHIVDTDPEKDRNTRIVDVSVPAMVRRAKQDQPPPALPTRKARDDAPKRNEPLEDLARKIRLFYARMHRVDRLTFWINLVTFVSAFLPWRSVLGRGLVSGIEGLGGASAGAALVVGLCIYSRTARRRLAGLVLLVQLSAAVAIVAVPVYLFFYHPGLGPHLGFVATALGGAAVVILTLARMAVRSY